MVIGHRIAKGKHCARCGFGAGISQKARVSLWGVADPAVAMACAVHTMHNCGGVSRYVRSVSRVIVFLIRVDTSVLRGKGEMYWNTVS
jgi:hypothetical protein